MDRQLVHQRRAERHDARDGVGRAVGEQPREAAAAALADDPDLAPGLGVQLADALLEAVGRARGAVDVRTQPGAPGLVAEALEPRGHRAERRITGEEARDQQHGRAVALRHAVAAPHGIHLEREALGRNPALTPQRRHVNNLLSPPDGVSGGRRGASRWASPRLALPPLMPPIPLPPVPKPKPGPPYELCRRSAHPRAGARPARSIGEGEDGTLRATLTAIYAVNVARGCELGSVPRFAHDRFGRLEWRVGRVYRGQPAIQPCERASAADPSSPRCPNQAPRAATARAEPDPH